MCCLGRRSSGKTSLMRLMAGLDAPSSGQVVWEGTDVTGMRVQDRRVAMVYQQFINYPSMTVYDNIASPMRLMGKSKAEIDIAVKQAADLMKLAPIAGPQAAGTVGRTAAALCVGPRAGQGRGSGAFGRAFGEPRLQVARRTARGNPEDIRRSRVDFCLCNHRARRGAAAGR